MARYTIIRIELLMLEVSESDLVDRLHSTSLKSFRSSPKKIPMMGKGTPDAMADNIAATSIHRSALDGFAAKRRRGKPESELISPMASLGEDDVSYGIKIPAIRLFLLSCFTDQRVEEVLVWVCGWF